MAGIQEQQDDQPKQARAIYDFEGDGGGELTVRTDELVTVIRQDVGDGWWEAKDKRGRTGLVPEAYMEIVSVPEPAFPPPPPPQLSAPQQNNLPAGRLSWTPQGTTPTETSRPFSVPAQHPPQAQAPRASWNQPQAQQPQHEQAPWQPPSRPMPAQAAPPTHLDEQGRQDSYDDWDDDWDDDDSSTTTETPSEFSASHNHSGAPSGGRASKKNKDDDSNKFGTVRKPFSKFSHFSKSGGEAYLFNTTPISSVPDADKQKATITEANDGPVWKPFNTLFSVEIKHPKKETKYKGMKSFIAYTLTPSFAQDKAVSRRYKHFDWLHGQLEDKFTTIVIPPLPDKQIAGRFEDDFIEGRMHQLQQWMDRICRHPVLCHSDVVHHFLCCTDEKQWKQGKRRAEKDEYKGGRFFFTVNAPARALDPIDQDALISEVKLDKFGKFIKSMDDSVRHMISVSENNQKKHAGPFRKEYQKIGGSFIAMARSFEHDERPSAQPLTAALEDTGRTYENIGTLFAEQPKNDMAYLLDGLHEYKGILSCFPDILSVPRAALGKISESAGRLQESEIRKVQANADVISYATLAEMNHFNQYRCADFKVYMQQYLQGQIAFYKEITARLEDNLRKYDQL